MEYTMTICAKSFCIHYTCKHVILVNMITWVVPLKKYHPIYEFLQGALHIVSNRMVVDVCESIDCYVVPTTLL